MLLFCLLVIGSYIYATEYKVLDIIGNVWLEVTPGEFNNISVGDVLVEGNVIKTGLNSSVTIKDNNDIKYTIPSMKKDFLNKLLANKLPVRIAGKVYETDTSNVARRTSNISTASSRASEQELLPEWIED